MNRSFVNLLLILVHVYLVVIYVDCHDEFRGDCESSDLMNVYEFLADKLCHQESSDRERYIFPENECRFRKKKHHKGKRFVIPHRPKVQCLPIPCLPMPCLPQPPPRPCLPPQMPCLPPQMPCRPPPIPCLPPPIPLIPSMPCLPPMPPPIIQCPPKPCPPKPCPPIFEECSYTLFLLDQLLTDTMTELRMIITGLSAQLKTKLQNSLKAANELINQKIINSNALLGSAISGIINSSNSNTTSAVVKVVGDENNVLLTGVNNLIKGSNDSITTLITDLAGQPGAQIVITVKDLTTSAGLLAQLNAILTTLTNGVNSLFATQTPIEIGAVTNIMNTASSKLINDVKAAIVLSTASLAAEVMGILRTEAAQQNEIIIAYARDVLAASEYVMMDYGRKAAYIIKSVLCGGFPYGSNPGNGLDAARRNMLIENAALAAAAKQLGAAAPASLGSARRNMLLEEAAFVAAAKKLGAAAPASLNIVPRKALFQAPLATFEEKIDPPPLDGDKDENKDEDEDKYKYEDEDRYRYEKRDRYSSGHRKSNDYTYFIPNMPRKLKQAIENEDDLKKAKKEKKQTKLEQVKQAKELKQAEELRHGKGNRVRRAKNNMRHKSFSTTIRRK